jgi:hypothetical protein
LTLSLSLELSQRERRKQRPEIVVIRNLKSTSIGRHEKASPRRKNDIVRIKPPSQNSRKSALRQRGQAEHVPIHQDLRRLLVT